MRDSTHTQTHTKVEKICKQSGKRRQTKCQETDLTSLNSKKKKELYT